MSNRVYECFLKTGLPKRPDGKSYSPTAYNIYRTICYRYDKDKGYAYPGESSLVLASGVSRQSVNRALTELKQGGVLVQKTKGYKNQRAEFIPVYHLKKSNESVNPALHITETNETSFDSERDRLEKTKGKENPTNGTGLLDPISNLTISKSSNENLEELLNFIPITRRPLPLSKEVTNLLKDLRHKGTSSKAIEDHFYGTNWQEIINSNAFVIDRLKNLNARPVKYSKEFPPPYCGECDPVERKFPYVVEDSNGQTSQYCFTCNWYWVNKRNGY